MDQRENKFKEAIWHAASDFIQIESNYQSLITVTDVAVSKDFQKATIFVTVFPEQKQNAGIDFLKRQRREFKQFIKNKTRLGRIPQFDFQIDLGEKSRQRIDEII